MKNIVITGTTKGIGKEVVSYFLEHGHRVACLNRNEIILSDYPNSENLIPLYADLEAPETLASVAKKIPFKTIDILINNAGILIKKPFEQMSYQEMESSWKVNFLSPYFLIQSVLERFISGSHVVNISTMGAVQGSVKFPELTAYGTSKAALTNLTELLAVELEPKKIQINCLALGAVQTVMLETAFPGYQAPTTPKEIAQFIATFSLSGNAFFNGKILPVSLSTP